MKSGVELEYRLSLREHFTWHWHVWSEQGIALRFALFVAVGVLLFVAIPFFLTGRRPLSTWAWWLPLIWVTALAGAALHISAGIAGEWWNLRQRGDAVLRWRFGLATFSVTVGDDSREHLWSDIGVVRESRDHFLVTGEQRVAGVKTLPIPKSAIDSQTMAQLRIAAQSTQRAG